MTGLGAAARRAVLKTFVALAGAGALPRFAWSMVKGGGPGLELLHPCLTPPQRALLAAVSERIVPATDTPGAIAAGVPQWIEMMLADWFSPESRNQFLNDFRAVDAAALATHHRVFAALTPADQDAILTLAMRKALPGAAPDFFERIRDLVVTGYYRSEAGATIEQVYLPVPGPYVPDCPYAKVRRVFSS